MKVFIINGYPGAGKDTFVKFCKGYSKSKNEIIVELWTSTPAKKALTYLGWEGEKTPETRAELARIMAESNRLFDTSFKYVSSMIHCEENIQLYKAVAVFIHSREPHNIARYKGAFGAKALLIDRVPDPDSAPLSNPSDKEVLEYKGYDIVIPNSGTLEELEQKAIEFVNTYVLGGAEYGI